MFGKESTASNSQSTILAIHPGALGDLVLFGHLLSDLDGRISLVAGREKSQLLVELGVAEEALDFDALPIHEVFTDTPLEQCQLPRLLGRHERLISFLPFEDRKAQLRLAAMCHAANATFLPARPAEDFTGHLLQLWCDLIGARRAATTSEPWPVRRDWLEAAKRELADIGINPSEPYVLIHPGAGSSAKCWPLQRFVELSRSLDSKVFVLGPVECDRWPELQIASLRQAPTLLSPSLSVLAGLAAGAAGFVGNDSGVAHLAAAVGAATVALFGPSRAAHFAPRGPRVKVICAKRIEDIEPGQVLDALDHLRE